MPTYTGSLGSSYQLELIINVTSQSVSGNSSTISCTLQIRQLAGSGSWSNWNDNTWSRTVNGASASGTKTYDFRNYDVLVLSSWTQVVPHNADGTKTITFSAAWDDHGGTSVLDGSLSGSLTLATIPRASTPTLSDNDFDAGTAITINTNRASTSFTHTARYVFGGASGTIATGVGASTSWTAPLSLLNEIPNAVSGTGTIYLDTYSGATLIGTKSVGFTLRAGAGIIPDFTTVTYEEAVALVELEVGALVHGVSKLDVAITGAVGAYGSTISAYKITIAGQTINAASGQTAALGQSGTLALVGEITDSRGRKRTRTVNVPVLAYAGPSIDAALYFVRRALVGGTVDENGTYIRVDLKASVSSLINSTERNRLRYKISTRLRGTTTWTVKVDTTLAGLTIDSAIVLTGPYSVSSSYEVRTEVIDDLGGIATIDRTVATSVVTMHWKGNTVAIGKFWEQGALDVAGDIYQSGQKVVDVGDLATTTVAGIVELATSAEAQTGTDTSRAVTPAALAARTATDTRAGVIEIATAAEVEAATDTARAVTPGRMTDHPGVPFAMAAGAVGFTASGPSTVGITITLPANRFTQAPLVAVNLTTGVGGSQKDVPRIYSVSTTSMTAGVWTGDQSSSVSHNTGISWIAVQMTSAASAG